MSNYSADAADFLNDYRKKSVSQAIEDHQDIIKDFGEQYERAYQLLNTFQAEAYRDQSMFLGYQWSLEEISYLNNQRRNSFTYNICRRYVNLIDGIQRQNRLATIYTPIEDASDKTAELLSDVGQYIMQYAGGYEKLSDCFKSALITGISWIWPYLDYRDDPVNGDVKFHESYWNDTMWDPYFYRTDLSDCSFVARRKYLARTEVISLLPDKADIIDSLPYGTRDDKFTYMPWARTWSMQKLLNYTEYWRKVWKMKDVLVDMESGETTEWTGDKARLRIIQAMMPNIKLIRKPVRTVELGIIVEGELLYYGEDPFGLNDYPCVPIFGGEYQPSFDLYTYKLCGVIRFIRDPQVELNKRISKLTDIYDSQLNSGYKAKTGAVTNPSSLFKSGQGQVLFIKPEASMDDVQRLDAPSVPPDHFQLAEMFQKLTSDIMGVSTEMFGIPENEKIETAAMLAKMRQSAGLVNLRGTFDKLAESQKILGDKVLTLMQKNYSPEKVKAITKKDPTDEFYSGNWARYNVVVEQGLLTETQRQSQYLQLVTLRQMEVIGPEANPLIIKNSNLHGKEELNKILDAKADQEQQIMARQTELEQNKLRLIADGIESKAHSDQALAMERLATINLKNAENAERIQKAETDRSAAELNVIKALKELQGMDLGQIQQKIDMLKAIHEMDMGIHEKAIAHRELDLQERQAMQQPMNSQTPVS
jgi:hypothetical protein